MLIVVLHILPLPFRPIQQGNGKQKTSPRELGVYGKHGFTSGFE